MNMIDADNIADGRGPGVATVRPMPARPAGKRLIEGLVACWVMPRVWVYRLLCLWLGEDRALHWLSESVASVPGPRGVLVRAAVCRAVLG